MCPFMHVITDMYLADTHINARAPNAFPWKLVNNAEAVRVEPLTTSILYSYKSVNMSLKM